MKKYEIIQEVLVPCAGELVRQRRTVEERTLVSPERYVRGLYKDQPGLSYQCTHREGHTVYDVVFDDGGVHRYSFTLR